MGLLPLVDDLLLFVDGDVDTAFSDGSYSSCGERLAVLRHHSGADRDELSSLRTAEDYGVSIDPHIGA